MMAMIAVMSGGALGAAARYLASLALAPRQAGFPLATLCVNLLGALLMGLLAAAILRGSANEAVRLFAGVGLLGGFTTFSAFGLESWQLIERGTIGTAGLYILASVTGSILLTGAGLALGRAW